MNLFDLTGATVLLTGGYGYLGRALARGLAAHGATVHVLARSRDKFDAAFAPGDEVRFVECDIASAEQIRAAFSAINDAGSSLDVLINNAMYVRGGRDPLAISDEDWSYSMDGVVGSAYRCIREAAPYMQRQNSGSIVNVASMYGMVSHDFAVYEHAPGSLNPPHYGAGKAALIQLTRYFAKYLGRWNVRVNCISPGPFPDEQGQRNHAFMQALSSRTALARLGQPDELVGAAVYLSSRASSYVTGHNLVVDGGWTAT
jgi:NAD(P)-dependent dehydrogenase (short-subunit alcohol dehydrogenase family)